MKRYLAAGITPRRCTAFVVDLAEVSRDPQRVEQFPPMIPALLRPMLVSIPHRRGQAQEAVTMTQGRCMLQYAVGCVEECPGAACLFWDGEEDACVLAAVRHEFDGRPDVAQYLLEFRQRLACAARAAHVRP